MVELANAEDTFPVVSLDQHGLIATPEDAAKGIVSISLSAPIEVNERQVLRLSFRPLKVKDMVACQRLGGDPIDMTLNLVARATDLPREIIDEIAIEDAEALIAEVDRLSGKSARASGKGSS